MTAVQAPIQYPGYVQQIAHLIDAHKRLTDEPLLLAIYYKPDREAQDIFLFEVIENFGEGAVDPDRELFEVTYNSTSGFPLEPGQHLHLILTNPREFEVAVREQWPLAQELQQAVRIGAFRTLHSDPRHAHLREMVNA